VKFTAHISLLEYMYREVCKWMQTCQRGERGAEVVWLGHKSTVTCHLKERISVSGKTKESVSLQLYQKLVQRVITVLERVCLRVLCNDSISC
jgi:hypothetical protein